MVDILLTSSSYHDVKLIFVENTGIHSTNGISLLDFLQLFDSLIKPAKESLLNNILKTNHGNNLYSYQINNDTITFI